MNNYSVFDGAIEYMKSRKLPISGWKVRNVMSSKTKIYKASFTGGAAKYVFEVSHPDLDETHLITTEFKRIITCPNDAEALVRLNTYSKKALNKALKKAGVKLTKTQPVKLANTLKPTKTLDVRKEHWRNKFMTYAFRVLPSGDKVGDFQELDCFFGRSKSLQNPGFCSRINWIGESKEYSPAKENKKTLNDAMQYAFDNMVWPKISQYVK